LKQGVKGGRQASIYQAGCVHAKWRPGARISRRSQRTAARTKKKIAAVLHCDRLQNR